MQPPQQRQRVADRITVSIAVAGVLIAGVCLALGGVWMGLSAVVGGALAVGNWLSLRWLGARILSSTTKNKGGVALLFALKMGALLTLLYLLIKAGLDPLGLVAGLGALVVGGVAGGLLGSLGGDGELNGEER